MTKRLSALLIIFYFCVSASADTNLQVGGFLKFDGFYDTRGVVSAREGHYLLYPTVEAPGTDINRINFVNFQSRIRVKLTSPEAFGAKVSGLLEGDFFGTGNGYENQFRLRHAFIKLSWLKQELLAGQYWTPLFTAAVFPQVVSFNTGAPFQPFARMPQIRLTSTLMPGLKVITALTMQRDAFQEIGGRKLQQDSGLPGTHLHLQFTNPTILAGLGGHIRTIRPEVTSDCLTSHTFTAYTKITSSRLTLRTKIIYGSDMADHIMLGGFAAIMDSDSNVTSFQPLKIGSAWADLTTTNAIVNLGIFAGYTTNLGMDYNLEEDNIYVLSARSPGIAWVKRVSPRITYSTGKLRLAIELEATSVLYASDYNANLIPIAQAIDKPLTNIRGLLALYLFF